MRHILISLSLAAALVSGGCATVKGMGEDLNKVFTPASQAQATPTPAATASQPVQAQSAPVAAASPSSVDCEAQQQTGCWELRVLSFGWDAKNSALAGLDRPYANQAERQDRAQHLGPRLWEEYRAGRVKAAAPKSYLVYMWNVNEVPTSNLSAYRVNTPKHTVVKTTVEEVTNAPAPVFDPATNLGKPARVFRVRTTGADAVGASVQVPWDMPTDTTYLLFCAEGTSVVYPPGKNVGLWITPESIKWLRAKGSKRLLVPFVAAN
jgi:predicted small secreted protein